VPLIAEPRHRNEPRAIAPFARLGYLLSVPYGGLLAPITDASLRLDPVFDALRGDPRFQQPVQETAPAKGSP